MASKLQFILLTIFTLCSSLFALPSSTTKSAAINTIDIPKTSNTGPTHLHHHLERHSDTSPSNPTNKPIKQATVITHLHPRSKHLSKTSNLLPRIYPSPPHEAPPSTDLFTNTSDTSPVEETGGKKWYEAQLVDVATWAIWLYVIASVLGLLALWGKGVIGRNGEWIGRGGRGRGEIEGRGSGRRGARRHGQWRRLGPGELERLGF